LSARARPPSSSTELQKQASVDLHRPIEPQLVAFTGTPLLKDDKTQNKFGPILHAYTMQRAVEQV
jgi:type I site-specific restriction-modification system R (restriction) subunit